MAQRVFDIENEKDMQDLWDILPDKVSKIEASCGDVVLVYSNVFRFSIDDIFSINFHDKTEITRPIPEATEQDVGKLCYFWDDDNEHALGKTNGYGILTLKDVAGGKCYYIADGDSTYEHCRRLTKTEIEELC